MEDDIPFYYPLRSSYPKGRLFEMNLKFLHLWDILVSLKQCLWLEYPLEIHFQTLILYNVTLSNSFLSLLALIRHNCFDHRRYFQNYHWLELMLGKTIFFCKFVNVAPPYLLGNSVLLILPLYLLLSLFHFHRNYFF